VVATEPGGPDWDEVLAATRSRLSRAAPELIDVAGWTPLLDASGPSDEPTTEPAAAEAVAGSGAGSADQVAFLQLSGGTTGVSKLIPRTHDDYLYSVRASAEICGVSDRTVMLVSLPAAHNFAMSSPGILGVLHAGGTVVLARDPSPGTAFRLIAAERVTMASLVPPPGSRRPAVAAPTCPAWS